MENILLNLNATGFLLIHTKCTRCSIEKWTLHTDNHIWVIFCAGYSYLLSLNQNQRMIQHRSMSQCAVPTQHVSGITSTCTLHVTLRTTFWIVTILKLHFHRMFDDSRFILTDWYLASSHQVKSKVATQNCQDISVSKSSFPVFNVARSLLQQLI